MKVAEVITWDSFDFSDRMNFTNAGFDLRMTRYKMKYIINYYIPSGLFVVVSWVSVTIEIEISLGLFVAETKVEYLICETI